MGAPKAAATPAAAPLDTKSRLSLETESYAALNSYTKYCISLCRYTGLGRLHQPVWSEEGIGKSKILDKQTSKLRQPGSDDGTAVNHGTLFTDKET